MQNAVNQCILVVQLINTMTTQTKTSGKTVQGAAPQQEQKPEVSAAAIAPTGKPVTVEERILRIASLAEKVATRKTVITHLEKVEAMKFGEFEEKEIVSISDGKSTYTIKSPLLLRKVQETLRNELKTELSKIESEIQF